MLAIAFEPVTTTNLPLAEYPPSILLNKELKKCFLDASTIFNTHYDIYPNRWNTEPASTGSAYLNTVTALYFNLMFGYTSVKSKYMHEVSRFIYQVATDYYSAEINTLSNEIPFSVDEHFPWEYTTKGFQFLRNYGLMECPGSCRADWTNLLGFCKERRIDLGKKEEINNVEVKVKKTLSILDYSLEVPKEISTEELATSMWLMDKLGKQVGGDLEHSINTLKVQNVFLVTRKGQECSVGSLEPLELESILSQLKESPTLLKQLLWLGTTSGPVS